MVLSKELYNNFIGACREYRELNFTISVFYKEAFEDHNYRVVSAYGGPFAYMEILRGRRLSAAKKLKESIGVLSAAIKEDKENYDPDLLSILHQLDKVMRVKYGLC